MRISINVLSIRHSLACLLWYAAMGEVRPSQATLSWLLTCLGPLPVSIPSARGYCAWPSGAGLRCTRCIGHIT